MEVVMMVGSDGISVTAGGRSAYRFRERPVKEVEIGGRVYRVELGNLTFSIEAQGLAEKMRAIAEPGIPADEVLSRAEAFSASVRAMCAAMFGDEAAEELVGGDRRLDLPRIADVVSIMADIASSEESLAAARSAFAVA